MPYLFKYQTFVGTVMYSLVPPLIPSMLLNIFKVCFLLLPLLALMLDLQVAIEMLEGLQDTKRKLEKIKSVKEEGGALCDTTVHKTVRGHLWKRLGQIKGLVDGHKHSKGLPAAIEEDEAEYENDRDSKVGMLHLSLTYITLVTHITRLSHTCLSCMHTHICHAVAKRSLTLLSPFRRRESKLPTQAAQGPQAPMTTTRMTGHMTGHMTGWVAGDFLAACTMHFTAVVARRTKREEQYRSIASSPWLSLPRPLLTPLMRASRGHGGGGGVGRLLGYRATAT